MAVGSSGIGWEMKGGGREDEGDSGGLPVRWDIYKTTNL